MEEHHESIQDIIEAGIVQQEMLEGSDRQMEEVGYNMETLANEGPSETGPCAGCGKPTKSHVVVTDGDGWWELKEENTLSGVEPGSEIRFGTVCHSCFIDMDDDWKPSYQGTVVSGVFG